MQDRDRLPYGRVDLRGDSRRLVGQGVNVLYWIHSFGNIVDIDVINGSIVIEEGDVIDSMRIGMHD